MLDSLRKSASSWVIKLLFVLLILSFGVWGVGDMVTGAVTGGSFAVKVGDAEVPPSDIARDFKSRVSRMGQLGENPMIRDNLLSFVLSQAADRAALDMGAMDLNLGITDEALRQDIISYPAFHNDKGQFDKNIFATRLAQADYSEADYIRQRRALLTRDVLVDPLYLAVSPPKSLIDRLFSLEQERRLTLTIRLPFTALPKPALPDEATLTAYYEQNKDRFTAPEYRAVTFVTLSPDNVKDEVTVSEEQIAARYQDQIDSLKTPEKRKVEQIVLDDPAQVETAKALIAANTAFSELAAQLKLTPRDMGLLAASDLPKESSGAVFSLPEGGVSQPVESALGWHVFHLTAIQPAVTKPLDEMRAEIAAQMKGELTGDALYQLSNRFEDALGGGATLEEAAATLNLPLRKIAAMDNAGQTPDGGVVPDLPDLQRFLSTAFAAELGLPSPLTQAENLSYILRVDTIDEPAVKPFAQVRAQVLASWQGERLKEEALKTAQSLTERINNGEPVVNVAGNFPIDAIDPITRDGAARPDLPQNLAAQVFTLPKGKAAYAEAPDAYVIAVVSDILPADPTKFSEALVTLTENVKGGMGDDLRVQLTQILRERYGVEVNSNAVKAN